MTEVDTTTLRSKFIDSQIRRITKTFCTPCGWQVSITDMVVKQRPDDIAYERSKLLWETITRGCADISIVDFRGGGGYDVGDDNPTVRWTGRLRGFHKFGYAEDHTYEFPHTKEDISSFIFTTKENGECFHILPSPCLNGKGRLIIFGSKNVHAAVFVENDHDFYTKPWLEDLRSSTFPEERYNFAFQLVGQLILEVQKNQKLQNLWSEFLTLMENNTAIAEACDVSRTEHLVQYKDAQMFWLGWKTPDVCGFLSESPVSMRNKFQYFGFNVPHNIIDVPASDTVLFDSTKHYFQTAANSEGAVVYVVSTNGCVVSMYKEKNFDYVRRRAVREQVKSGASSLKLQYRIESLHVPYTKEFLQTALEFNAWVQMRIFRGLTTLRDVDQSFITQEQSFASISQAERDRSIIDWDSNVKSKKIIIIVGAPCQGCGKTRFSNVLTHVLNQILKTGMSKTETMTESNESKTATITESNESKTATMTESGRPAGPGATETAKHRPSTKLKKTPSTDPVCRVSQDDCQGQRKLFLQTVAKKVDDPNIQIVIIDKYNNGQNCKDYESLQGIKIFVGFFHPQDEEYEIDDAGYGKDLLPVRRPNLIEHCMKNIQSRGNCHKSLRFSDMSKDDLYSTLQSFSSKWFFPYESSGFDRVIELSVIDSTKTQIVEFMFLLAELQSVVPMPLLPDLSSVEFSDLIQNGLKLHANYENKCAQSARNVKKQVKSTTKLWKIECDSKSEQVIQQLCRHHAIPDDFQLPKSHHVTLVYFKDKIDEKIDEFWQIHQGKIVSFTSRLILHNDKTWALKVDINPLEDTTFQNQSQFQKDLHITLAYRNTSSPVDTLQLFSDREGDDQNIRQILLESQIVLNGSIQRVGTLKI